MEREPTHKPHPDDEEEIRQAIEEVERGETVLLTQEMMDRWVETGEWPTQEELDALSSS